MGMCEKCGTKAGFGMMICEPCQEKIRQSTPEAIAKRKREEAAAALVERAKMVVLTTAPTLAGHTITRTLDIVTAECVFGMNLFRDFFAGMSDIIGGRSEATQKILREARSTCLLELRKEAARVGANAVIAVDLDYSEFSGQGKSMLFLVASGTAVVVVTADS